MIEVVQCSDWLGPGHLPIPEAKSGVSASQSILPNSIYESVVIHGVRMETGK